MARKWKHTAATTGALADTRKGVVLNIASNGQSSSILEPGTHAFVHPEVVFIEKKELQATTIDHLFAEASIGKCKFINLDIQGAELLALKGAVGFLEHVRYIYTEVNEHELYQECPLIPELYQFLSAFGFSRVETEMTSHGWGDAFYIR